MSNNPRPNNKQRKDRPLAALNRAILKRIATCPSSSAAFTTVNGRGMRKSFVKDICTFMTVMVNEMDITSRKVGVGTKFGFSLRSWAYIAELCDLPKWRIEQCAKFAISKGWITSKQPRERYTGKNNRDQWRGLASIKRVSEEYFDDLGILQNYKEAIPYAKQKLKAYAEFLQRPIKYVQTPITLLRRRRKEAAAKAVNTPNAPEPIPV